MFIRESIESSANIDSRLEDIADFIKCYLDDCSNIESDTYDLMLWIDKHGHNLRCYWLDDDSQIWSEPRIGALWIEIYYRHEEYDPTGVVVKVYLRSNA
jgi:hypothetical protein